MSASVITTASAAWSTAIARRAFDSAISLFAVMSSTVAIERSGFPEASKSMRALTHTQAMLPFLQT